MKYAVETGSVTLMYIPSFIKIGSGIFNLLSLFGKRKGRGKKRRLMRSPYCLRVSLLLSDYPTKISSLQEYHMYRSSRPREVSPHV
jgi:hypothetical protein